MNDLRKLSPEEYDLVLRAPILVAILIAGADGDVDQKEIHAAINFAKKAQRQSSQALKTLYDLVSEDFEDKLLVLMQSYPTSTTKRNEQISGELAGLSQVWSKMDPTLALDYYNSIKAISRRTAESSGGFLGLSKVGPAESQYVDLKMIAPPR